MKSGQAVFGGGLAVCILRAVFKALCVYVVLDVLWPDSTGVEYS